MQKATQQERAVNVSLFNHLPALASRGFRLHQTEFIITGAHKAFIFRMTV